MTKPRILLAPMQGLTTWVVRDALARHYGGLDAAVAPFLVAAGPSPVPARRLHDLLPEHNRRLPLVPQLLSNDAAAMLAAGRELASLGYRRVDWNLGCPFSPVTRKGRGAGLLPHPERIVGILEAVLPPLAVEGIHLSIKTRLGLDDPRELERLLPALDPLPLASITIHPRVAAQQYAGTVDLDGFERCLGLTRHPVAYNGDLRTAAGFAALQQRFGDRVSGWMIGRGVLSDPELPERLAGRAAATDAERWARFLRFHDDLRAEYGRVLSGPRHVMDKLKELWLHFAAPLEGGARLLRRITRSRTPEELGEILHALPVPGRLDSGLERGGS